MFVLRTLYVRGTGQKKPQLSSPGARGRIHWAGKAATNETRWLRLPPPVLLLLHIVLGGGEAAEERYDAGSSAPETLGLALPAATLLHRGTHASGWAASLREAPWLVLRG